MILRLVWGCDLLVVLDLVCCFGFVLRVWVWGVSGVLGWFGLFGFRCCLWVVLRWLAFVCDFRVVCLVGLSGGLCECWYVFGSLGCLIVVECLLFGLCALCFINSVDRVDSLVFSADLWCWVYCYVYVVCVLLFVYWLIVLIRFMVVLHSVCCVAIWCDYFVFVISGCDWLWMVA